MSAPNFLRLGRQAAGIASDKKCIDILLLNIKNISSIADYFLIATAESFPQMRAVTETVFKTFRDEEGLMPTHSDWRSTGSWAVIDYGGIVIHIMLPSAREFYALEKIWVDARKIKVD